MVAEEIRKLLSETEKQDPGRALSVYLNVDQSNPANRNREFESTLKTLLRPLAERQPGDEAEQEEFQRNVAQCTEFLADYKPDGKTLVLFSAEDAGFFWARALRVPMRERAVWNERPCLHPLIEVVDEHERYAVAIIHRGRARILFAHMGELEEGEGVVEAEVRHYKKVGTDHWRSQANFERHAEEHAHSHARRVARALLEAHQLWPFDRLVVAGAVAARKELEQALPKRLSRRVAGSIPLPIDASREQLLRAVAKIESETDRAEGLRTVQGLLTVAGKRRRAVIGPEATIRALVQGRVDKLVYSDDFQPRRPACLHCGAAGDDGSLTCPQCGEECETAERLLEETIGRVDLNGGRVSHVRDEAAELLAQEGGGIGAFLRY